MLKVIVFFAIILLAKLSLVPAAPVDDGKETEAIVTPLDVKPAEVQIVQESRQPRSAYYYGGGYGGYGGLKYAPVLSYYGYPRYYAPYYGYRRSPYVGFYG